MLNDLTLPGTSGSPIWPFCSFCAAETFDVDGERSAQGLERIPLHCAHWPGYDWNMHLKLSNTKLIGSTGKIVSTVKLVSYMCWYWGRLWDLTNKCFFFSQIEEVRLGLPRDKPAAVQQWQGLIAGTIYAFQVMVEMGDLTISILVNYAARRAGITRHCNVQEAKEKCPGPISS